MQTELDYCLTLIIKTVNNMSKIKTVYDELLPDVKKDLQANARKYAAAKRLKYVLMSKYMWSNLTIDEMRDLFTYSNIKTW